MPQTSDNSQPGRKRIAIEASQVIFPAALVLIIWLLWEVLRLVQAGILVWLLFTPVSVLAFLFLASVVNLFSTAFAGREGVKRTLRAKISISLVSIVLSLTLFEALLDYQAATIDFDPNDPAQVPLVYPLTFPQAWEKRPIEMEDAAQAYYWHGHLHAHTASGVRLLRPPPPKDPQICRILVVGDSFTYGVGVPEEATYCSLLRSLLEKEFRIEVLNMGIPGKQSADLRIIVEAYTRSLEPDLVVYGVCLNDYLPSGDGEQTDVKQQSLPLPAFLRELLINKTRTGPFLGRGLFALSVATGVEKSFLGEILANMETYRPHFRDDVRAMNASVTERGLPPIVAMVLIQSPRTNSQLQELVESTETSLQDAGMTVVETDSYFKHNDGQRMEVSPWDRHPNSTAHSLFAQMLAKRIRELPLMKHYRNGSKAANSGS